MWRFRETVLIVFPYVHSLYRPAVCYVTLAGSHFPHQLTGVVVRWRTLLFLSADGCKRLLPACSSGRELREGFGLPEERSGHQYLQSGTFSKWQNNITWLESAIRTGDLILKEHSAAFVCTITTCTTSAFIGNNMIENHVASSWQICIYFHRKNKI